MGELQTALKRVQQTASGFVDGQVKSARVVERKRRMGRARARARVGFRGLCMMKFRSRG